MTHGPAFATVQDLRDYLDWQVQCGHGKCLVAIDRRGLTSLRPDTRSTVGIGLPPAGERHDPKTDRVFVRAVA